MNFTEMLIIAKPLIVAIALGMVLGLERLFARKPASMRTYAMVSMGSALFVVIGQNIFQAFANLSGINPLQIAGQIVVGIGFLCTGLIIHHRNNHIIGLTTASSLWLSSGIGIACGFGMYTLAVIATVLTLGIFIVLYFIEGEIKEIADEIDPLGRK